MRLPWLLKLQYHVDVFAIVTQNLLRFCLILILNEWLLLIVPLCYTLLLLLALAVGGNSGYDIVLSADTLYRQECVADIAWLTPRLLLDGGGGDGGGGGRVSSPVQPSPVLRVHHQHASYSKHVSSHSSSSSLISPSLPLPLCH